jgi:hypothetical protein
MHLQRRSTAGTLAPHDSISNAPADEDDRRLRDFDADPDYLLHDPYANPSYDHLPMPYGDAEDAERRKHSRFSSYDAPLIANAGPAGGYGDAASVYSAHKYEPVEKGGLTNEYPPPLGPGLRSGEAPYVKRPSLWRRWLRDPTPLDERIENYKRGIGIQVRRLETFM